jgi:hypothetical protein
MGLHANQTGDLLNHFSWAGNVIKFDSLRCPREKKIENVTPLALWQSVFSRKF